MQIYNSSRACPNTTYTNTYIIIFTDAYNCRGPFLLTMSKQITK